MILKECDECLCNRSIQLIQSDKCLLLPIKFVQPFLMYSENAKSELSGEVHYLIRRKYLKQIEKQPNYSLKKLRKIGIISPSGKISYSKIHRTENFDNTIKFILSVKKG